MNNKLMYEVQRLNNVSVFNLYGELSAEQENDLNLLLMRAIHGHDRAVINLKYITAADNVCLTMLRDAYNASQRIKNPIIFTGVRKEYEEDIFSFEHPSETDRIPEKNEITV